MSKHTVTAQRKVAKALTVFSNAITEVEKAQVILKQGVEQDSMSILSLRSQIYELEARISDIAVAKEEKGIEMKYNAELITKLREFEAK